MGILVNIVIAAVVALIVFFIASALIVGHGTIIGLVCLLIFLILAFGGWSGAYGSRYPYSRRRGGPPVA